MNAKIKKILDAVLAFIRNTGEKIQNTHPVIQIASFLVCVGILFALFLSLAFAPNMKRSVFYFPSVAGNSTKAEIRYLPEARDREAKVKRYVSDALLGPISPDMKPLFNAGTKLVDCFVRGDSAYVNLSSEALVPESGVAPTDEAYALFKKNVCTNFRSIDRIYLYFEGIEVYSENPYADAGRKK